MSIILRLKEMELKFKAHILSKFLFKRAATMWTIKQYVLFFEYHINHEQDEVKRQMNYFSETFDWIETMLVLYMEKKSFEFEIWGNATTELFTRKHTSNVFVKLYRLILKKRIYYELNILSEQMLKLGLYEEKMEFLQMRREQYKYFR